MLPSRHSPGWGYALRKSGARSDSTAWYDGLQANNGGDASSFARFYRVPGMSHCGFRPSTDQFDMLSQLVAWVEKGQQPTSVVAQACGARKAVAVDPDVPASRPRPLCPYPTVARLRTGAIDLESAASFSCQ